jgi:PhzF family phenazine biosynthesis protein
MPVPIYQVDAFAECAFEGNPAAVCLLQEARDDAWMQSVAAEMNLAETAFLVRRDDGFSLRWFTPTVEVDLCGHATLASAHVLWQSGILPPGEAARFYTRSGLLTACRHEDLIDLDFPSEPVKACDPLPAMTQALGVGVEWTGRNRMDVLALLQTEEKVRELDPDMAVIATLDCRGLIVTAVAQGRPYDFVSRFFAPQSGIPEDPATGSTHCALAPFWTERLGRSELTGYQASKRGGTVRTILAGDRVILRGRAITILKGDLLT